MAPADGKDDEMIDEAIVKACLEQRVVLAGKMLDITKQMDEQCKLEEIELDSAINQRDNCMERIDKCNKLLELQIGETDDATQKEWKLIISGKSNTTANSYEQECAELAVKYKHLIDDISQINDKINTVIHERLEESKAFLRDARNAIPRTARSSTTGAGSAMIAGNLFF